ncbi:MAG: aminotransferase class V-fold PLP-dependent enzyme [Planctomycetes bacterium]|nr:aminotransferase class V-fold PLP-dependent enzyme [Planctomycetota bacterium]
MPVYLDCNATTPIEPRVKDEALRYMTEDFGNAGSRTHEYGNTAKRASQKARDQVGAVVGAERDEVLFTSGATESNNIAILGLFEEGERSGRKHIISSPLEHKAVLEPLEALESRGFEVELLAADDRGWTDPEALQSALRPDTLLVSLMHVNNETGIRQPIESYCEAMAESEAFLHVDAAQGFGKDLEPLKSKRIDLVSISGHKIYGPKGIGALIARRRDMSACPLTPLHYGGGQEGGLRPGTLPVHLAVGLGLAAELCVKDIEKRKTTCLAQREAALSALMQLDPMFNGDPDSCMPHAMSLSFPGVDSEALMVFLKNEIAVSNGSACTSHEYKPSHVLEAMGLERKRIEGAVRLSWCHMTEKVDWEQVATTISRLQ